MDNLFTNMYKGKKVFITGHSGFKGAWLSAWLLRMGAEVKGYSLEPDTNPSLFTELELAKNMQSVFADIRDYDRLSEELSDFKPEVVLHLAAQPLVRFSYDEPRYTLEVNAMGTTNILEAVRHCDSVRSVVNVTTDKCYENKETGQAYKETDPMGGYDPYSCSKGVSELITNSYRNSFFNPEEYGKKHQVALASARAGNVIGGGDWAKDRLIPDTVKSLAAGKKLILRSPDAVRPWQHVLEPLSGYLLLAARMIQEPTQFASGWNFGPETEDNLTVLEVVKKAIGIWGRGEYEIIPNTTMHEAKLLHLDISKAKDKLNWKPVYNFDQSVEQTILWYKGFYEDKMSAKELTERQLSDYLKTAETNNIIWSK